MRDKYPDVLIRVRADSGSGKPWLYRLCERLDVEYSSGSGMNYVLQRNTKELRQKEVRKRDKTGNPQRLFSGFDYQVGTWQQPRWVVVKCDANAQRTNRQESHRDSLNHVIDLLASQENNLTDDTTKTTGSLLKTASPVLGLS